MSDIPEHADASFGLDPETPVLDAEQLELLKSAGPELIGELVTVFNEECQPRIDQLPDICDSKDITAILENIHFIAGSAANLGLLRLASLCRTVEEQIRSNTFSAFDALAPAVRSEYDAGLTAFQQA